MADINLNDCPELTSYRQVNPNFVCDGARRIAMVTTSAITPVGYIFKVYFNVYHKEVLILDDINTLDVAVRFYNDLTTE